MTERRKRYVACPPNSCQELKDMAVAVKTIQLHIKCLHDSFTGYEPMLKQSLLNQKFWERVREHLAAGTAQSVVWAVILGFSAMVWYAVVEYIKHLAGK